jgi:hypothetical protein
MLDMLPLIYLFGDACYMKLLNYYFAGDEKKGVILRLLKTTDFLPVSCNYCLKLNEKLMNEYFIFLLSSILYTVA